MRPAPPVTRWLAVFAAAVARRREAAAPPPLAVRAASRRRAPRALVWALGSFAAAQLGLGVAAEVYPRIRDPLYGDKLVKLQRRLDNPPAAGPPSVVMFGSSRTGLAFHGLRIEQALRADLGQRVVAFNYGVPGSGPVTHLIYLNRLLAAGITPDCVLLEVLPSMLADGHGGPLERNWLLADRLTYSEQAAVIRYGFDPAAVRERWWESVLVPWYTLRFQLLTRIAPSWISWRVRFDWSSGADECGWGASAVQTVTPEGRAAGFARARAEYAAILSGMIPGGAATDALREFLAVCRARGIAVRLVLMPESDAFRAFYPPPVLARLDAFLAGVSSEYAAPVADARGWLPEAQFSDGHHVFVTGAETFSDRLTREVIAPFFRARVGGH